MWPFSLMDLTCKGEDKIPTDIAALFSSGKGAFMNRTREILVVTSCLVLLAWPALADVSNGDFESGGTDWTTTVPPDWNISFPAAGGMPDGHASIMSRYWDSLGEGCVSQVFDCGEQGETGTCTIIFDAMMQWIDSNELAGRLKVYVNGNLLWEAPEVNELPWTTVVLTVDCGIIELDLCLDVSPGNNMWEGRYDNVSAECGGIVDNDFIEWGGLKSWYR
jgi:hypothetical protein